MAVHEVNTHEAKSRLSELIREAEAGTDVIVARNGQPVAKIIPWPPKRPARLAGAWSGLVTYTTDPVASDDEVSQLFEDSVLADTPSGCFSTDTSRSGGSPTTIPSDRRAVTRR